MVKGILSGSEESETISFVTFKRPTPPLVSLVVGPEEVCTAAVEYRGPLNGKEVEKWYDIMQRVRILVMGKQRDTKERGFDPSGREPGDLSKARPALGRNTVQCLFSRAELVKSCL
jgi:hypothetical protein